MGKVLSLKFEYQGSTEYALIRVRHISQGTEFEITLNTDQLRELLGSDTLVIREINNELSTDGEICSLKGALMDMIHQHISSAKQAVN